MNNPPKENLISIDLGLYSETLKTLDEMRGLVPRRTYLRDLVELHTACWKGEVADTQWKEEHIGHNKSIIEAQESHDVNDFMETYDIEKKRHIEALKEAQIHLGIYEESEFKALVDSIGV